MKIILVIPTYNEVDNIGRLLDELQLEFKKMLRHDFGVLVVDANSPDGTGDVIKEKALENPNIHLLLEPSKRGLGAAYIYGFNYALRMMNPDVIIEMDADFQHDPKDVLRLVEAMDKGADYVIGSRFVKGGSIPAEWGFIRKMMSKGGSIFTKIVFGIKGINDFTSGFKATRVKGFMDQLNFDSIMSQGFAYKIDMLFKIHRLGARVVEVPIKFGLRDRGDSKMELNNFVDSLYVVLLLRANESRNVLIFLVVGTLGFIVDAFVFNLYIFLSALGMINISIEQLPSGSIASLLSGFIAMFVTFVLNNRWTFSERKISDVLELTSKMVLYYFSSYLPIILRSFIVKFAVTYLGDNFLINNAAFILGIFIGLLWNFTIYSKLIWRKGRENNKSKDEKKKARA